MEMQISISIVFKLSNECICISKYVIFILPTGGLNNAKGKHNCCSRLFKTSMGAMCDQKKPNNF